MVPAARDAENLQTALELGVELDVDVTVLCSLDATVPDVLALADLVEGSRCVALDVQNASSAILPEFETALFSEATGGSRGDLSFKRNLGLLLGRMCDWDGLLFLDDDIRDVDADRVRRAAGSLTHHEAVGMPAEHFPDNSVVYHARRMGNDDLGVFVSGSALVVNVGRARSFFPETYNEDWLFLAPALADGRVAESGTVRQKTYNPFEDPFRAHTEEFGDVLAEGLIGHLPRGGAATDAPTESYWDNYLGQRERFIVDTVVRCERSGHPTAAQAVLALETAEKARAQLSGDLFRMYLDKWDADREKWATRLRAAPRGLSIVAAAAELGVAWETNERHLAATR